VTDCFVYNNGSDVAITYGTTLYPIPAHSIAISVAGGTDNDIASAIWSKLDCGCGFSSQATTTVVVQDTIDYNAPYPSYPIRFVRPTPLQVYLTVNVAALPTLPADYVVQVQKAVAAAVTAGYLSSDGTISIPRARIGGQIIAAEYAAPVIALGNVTPVSLFIGTTPSPSSGASMTLGIDQFPVCTQLNINVQQVSV
jgi:hypothetical protein